jgi:hypothetical protein
MRNKPHLHLDDHPESVSYTYAGGVPVGAPPFQVPPRDRVTHGTQLAAEVRKAVTEGERQRSEQSNEEDTTEGQVRFITFNLRSEQDFQLRLESLDRTAQKIRLLSFTTDNGVFVANISMSLSKVAAFLKLIESYTSTDDRFGNANNRLLIESISSIKLAVVKDLWTDNIPVPSFEETLWWEIWLHRFDEAAEVVYQRFAQLAQRHGMQVSHRHVAFPERVVTLAFGTLTHFSHSLDLLSLLAEIRKAKELASHYTQLSGREQGEFVESAVSRLLPPSASAPTVCLLDTGVNQGHPLIAPALHLTDLHTVMPSWGVSDHHQEQHGTTMAGIALYGCLTTVLDSVEPIQLRHRLESVKLVPRPPEYNVPEVYGAVTKDAAARVIAAAPERNRAYCLTITSDDRDFGLPSQWSAALDDCCFGGLEEVPKLVFVATGNVQDELHQPQYSYHAWNCEKAGIQDPAQSWNAITVGAFTDKAIDREVDQHGWNAIAEPGDLTPTSRTSLPWPDKNQAGWPIKPDIVMEGGNYAERNGERSSVDDLSLLTTCLHPTGRLLTTTRDTSPATAAAARMGAIIWSYYPHFWPETVRALMVHSAEWTPAMQRRFPPINKAFIQKRLRCYGYGVPNLENALYSAKNAATLIFQGEIQPYHRPEKTNGEGRIERGDSVTNEMHLHELPWPVELLEQLGEVKVKMHVTLSYFIESSPGRTIYGTKFRYASHGLRFDVKRPTESPAQFRKRLTRKEWDGPKIRPSNVSETRNWLIGEENRGHGSIHSDWWEGTAATLAACNLLSVFPVSGWWKERSHLKKYDSKARYSLLVSIESPNAEIDLYGAITAQPEVITEVTV